jgi:hypothetical protein
MQRAGAVVGVRDADEVRDRGPEEDILDALGVPSRAGREIRFGDLAVVCDDLALGGFRRLVGRRGLAFEALVDLAGRVVVEVEAVAVDLDRERVGARGDRLRAQRRLGPGGRRLVGDDPLHVLVDGQRVDRVQRSGIGVGRHHLEGAAVAADADDFDVAAAGGAQLAPALGELAAAGGEQLDRGAGAVGAIFAGGVEPLAAGAGRAAESDVAADHADQDPHRVRFAQGPDRGPLEVVDEDEAVALAVLGVPVGAVLAHPDPVAVAVAVDHPGDLGAGRGRAREQAGRGQGQREQRAFRTGTHGSGRDSAWASHGLL